MSRSPWQAHEMRLAFIIGAFLVVGCIGGDADDPVVARSTATMFDHAGSHFGQIAVTKRSLTFREGLLPNADTDVVIPLDDVVRADPFQWNNQPGADVGIALELRNGRFIKFTVGITQRAGVLSPIQQRISERDAASGVHR